MITGADRGTGKAITVTIMVDQSNTLGQAMSQATVAFCQITNRPMNRNNGIFEIEFIDAEVNWKTDYITYRFLIKEKDK